MLKQKQFSAIDLYHDRTQFGEHNIGTTTSDESVSIDHDIAGTRERFPGEIIPVGATQSSTKDNDEANNGAGLAIDGDYTTKNDAVVKDGLLPWLKISLGEVYCVQQVVRRNQDQEVWQTWTCATNECTGVGENSGKFKMTISTEGAAFDLTPISDCSFGDTVTYRRKIGYSLQARAIVIIGRETTQVQGKLF